MKLKIWGALLFATSMLISSCSDNNAIKAPELNRSIVVIYDNDVHCAIDGYVKMAGYRDAIVNADTSWVATVSAGDYLQGGAIGAMSDGQYVIDVMKEMDYDAITFGNHEFDYKMPRLFKLMEQMPEGMVTCCNLYSADHKTNYYNDYVIKRMGDKKVAFVGVVTPGSMISEAAAFYDEDGSKLYDLCEDECVELVQNSVNKARAEGANYVILLAHLGEVDRGQTKIYTPTLIAKTRGIDMVLDGHTHSVIPSLTYPNLDGESVYNMQTGTKFEHIGKLVISADGKVSTELVSLDEISTTSAKVQAAVDAVKEKSEMKLKEVIGENRSANMNVLNENGDNLPRLQRVPLGTLIAEAFRKEAGAEIGLINGGGVRAALPMGEITYENLLDILPFGNDVMMVSATGQQILDALELSTNKYPTMSGGFLQCSGMRYKFDPNNKPVIEIAPATFELKVNGTRRVVICEVMDADGNYSPIDPEKMYKVASTTYVLQDGEEVVAFRQSKVLNEEVCLDIDALIHFITNELKGVIPDEYGQ